MDVLRDKNLRLGNRHLADKIAAMQEVSKRGVWSTNIDKKPTICGSTGSASYALANHQHQHQHHGYGHSTGGGSQKSLIINQNSKKPLKKEVTV